MLKKLTNIIHSSKKNKNIFVFSVFALLCTLHVIIGLIPAVREVSVTGTTIPVGLQVTSYIILAAHMTVCLICRIKHWSDILRAIFFYQLPAIIFFVIELGLRIGESTSASGIFLRIFDIWTVYSRTYSYLLTPFVGMGEIYTKLISHIVFMMITYLSYSGIKKSIAFKKKLSEKREMENNSRH